MARGNWLNTSSTNHQNKSKSHGPVHVHCLLDQSSTLHIRRIVRALEMYCIGEEESTWKAGVCARQSPWFTLLCFSTALTFSLSLVVLSLHCARLVAFGSLHRASRLGKNRSGVTERMDWRLNGERVVFLEKNWSFRSFLYLVVHLVLWETGLFSMTSCVFLTLRFLVWAFCWRNDWKGRWQTEGAWEQSGWG